MLLRMGDDVSTDEISPAGARALPLRSNIPKLAEFTFSRVDPEYAHTAADSRRTTGHLIIAGHNYGQGSSREHAAADLMAVLLANHLRHDFQAPDHPGNDHLVFSKGHASPLLYALYKAAGAISEEELLTFRKLGSRLEGHPTPRLPWVDVATGSLGQGLPIGVGIALTGERLDHLPYRVWVLCGDSEMAEGSMWDDRPTAIIARTHKGHGVSAVDDQEGKHGKPLPEPAEAIAELGGVRDTIVEVTPPDSGPAPRPAADGRDEPPRFEVGDSAATRTAFGQAVTALGAERPDLVVLDGEVGDSTRAGLFAERHPDRYFECYIAEQQMVAAAVGMQARG